MRESTNSATHANYLTVKLHWSGPYTVDQVDENQDGKGLYLFAGKKKYGRTKEILYCGITERKFKTRFREHHKLPLVSRELEIWLGKIEYPNGFHREHLEIAESIIIYFWQPVLNDRKKYSPPRPTTLISHWFKQDGTPRIYQRTIYKDLHDVLSWDGKLWRTGNLSVYGDA